MSSGITSSYSTIQDVFEEQDNPKSCENENGQETDEAQKNLDQVSSVSSDPSDGKYSQLCDNKNEKETPETTEESDLPLSPKDKPYADAESLLKEIRRSLTEDARSVITGSPVPQPRTKMNIHLMDDQNDAPNPTDDVTKETSESPDSTKPPRVESSYVVATGPLRTVKNIEVKRSSSLPKPERPPPPAGYYGRRPSTPKSPLFSDTDTEGQDSSFSSEHPSPVTPSPSGEMPFGVYRSSEDSDKPAVPPRPPLPKHYFSSSSSSVTSQRRPPPPTFDPPPPPSDQEPLYNEIHFPPYLHILPEHGRDTTPEKHNNFNNVNNFNSRSQRSSMACTQEILDILRWLKVVSKTEMTTSLYGVSLEEEIRTFHHTGLNLKKALRLYNLLMMKRSEPLRDHISELTSTCNALDKALKRKKTIQVAGGTTGAVGGVTALVGLALAPVTFGSSLIATAVGAGMAASAGAVSARAAKQKKKVITRDGVDRLTSDYIDKVKDIENCLTFILTGMNELRRYDIARLQRAGAQPDALKVAHLTHSVFSNMETIRKNSVTQAGGMSSERLLHGFAKEMDYYFTEKDGQKLKKSRKSRFSGRVRLLAGNLQDEWDYLNHMWELFN